MGTLFDVDTIFNVERTALIDPTGCYRYSLTRRWSAAAPINFVMLNPSTADGTADDPTVRRCVGFARDWGYGGIVVTNLFAFRATDPIEMKRAANPVGPENDGHLIREAKAAGMVVCAWGVHGSFLDRAWAVKRMFRESGIGLMALGQTKLGHPKHPLYLSAALRPTPFD